MIDTIQHILKLVVAILPFVLSCFANQKVNLPKPERSKQFFMPVITLVYVIVAMLFINRIDEWLIKIITKLPDWIAGFTGYSWMPKQVDSLIIEIANWVKTLLANINLNFWIFYISNTLIVWVYMAVKKFCIQIMAKAVKMDGELHKKIASLFYEYFPERDKWCLRDEFVQARSMFKVFFYSSIILSALLMLISQKLYGKGLLVSVYYPVFGILVVGELYFYLDGATRREYTSDILGEDEEAYKVVNYSLLRKFLRNLFGDKLLTENTSINNELMYDVTTDEIIRELENDEDAKIGCFATYMDALNKTGFKIDHNYLYSSRDMLNGKSILFNNPFYNDLIPYAFYPMNRALLSHQKVLVVLGRHSIEDDIKEWLEKGIESVTNIPFMWNIGVLNSEAQDLDIGIVTRSDVLDIELHNANSNFLENVGFFVIIEPSKLISTAQIGLNLLVKKCKTSEEKNIVFCMCDKNCDGLVDAMSHVLMTSITEVSATKKHLGTSSYMCWESDDEYLHHRLTPNISRYLGIGTELSFAALKNQVSKTKWYGGEAFPVTDIRWIGKQYYYDLTKYAGLPTNQEVMDEHFVTTPNFWSAEIDKNNYLTVEDESNNMFEILRDFSTRTTEQGFINVISSDYLLKDYMAENASIFEADAKAIPFIVSDYTRSNRNTILRIILMMSTFPVRSEILNKELSLLGITVFDLKQQLWYEIYNCFTKVAKLSDLPDDYSKAVKTIYKEPLSFGNAKWTHDIIKVEETYNINTGKLETTYAIADSKFMEMCVSKLRSAGYVAEDENGERYYLGAELCGHIYQKYLPGQFFTFGGKYYEMQYLTADGQVLVRRAADHITGRPAYRQVRQYTIHGAKPSEKIGAHQNIDGMRIIKEYADISVDTPSYYRMEKYNDFTTAKLVSFEGKKNGIPQRVYCNKEIIRIELPDFNGKLNDNIRYTITTLFNEIFKTIFAENQAYICALTDDSFLGETDETKPVTYSIKGDGYELNSNSIYIIEDSQLDLGLTVAVERNLQRIFSIIHDYLDWHMEALENSLNPPIEPELPVEFGPSEEKPEDGTGSKATRGIKKIIEKIKDWFKKKFKKKKKGDEQDPSPEGTATDTPVEPGSEGTPTETTGEPGAEEEKPKRGIKKVIEKIKDWFRKLFKRKKKGDEQDPSGEEVPTETPISPEDETTPETNPEGETEEPIVEPENIEGEVEPIVEPENVEETVEPIFEPEETVEPVVEPTENEVSNEESSKEPTELTECPAENEIEYYTEDEETVDKGFMTERKPYHKRYYMLYGKENEASFIDLAGTLGYLTEMGLQRNALKQAREGKKIAEYIEATYQPGKTNSRYCDFCGTEIFGVEYETLSDGRDRCMHCGKTAIKTGEEFQKIFEDVKRNMESFFGIKINAGIKVEMVNSKKLHKRLGKAFIPTPNSDGRVLGVAISDKNGYTLLVENGSPRIASMMTMAHELTHIWQYINWNDKEIRKKYGKDLRLEIYEGMAKWAEIQYAYCINEAATAKREEIITSYRDDEYGRGFIRYHANYPFSYGPVITKTTPFMNVETPLDPSFCGSVTSRYNLIEAGEPEDTDTPRKPVGGVKPVPTGSLKGPIERSPESFNRYAYNLLNEDEKKAYDLILQAINNFDAEITGFDGSITEEQTQKIVDYIQRDHPEIFWFQHGATFYFDANTHIVSKVELVYCMSQEETQKRQNEIETATRSFMTAVNNSMSDYEVTLHIYENIIKLVDYDTLGLEQQDTEKVVPDVPDDLRSVYGVFVNKKAVCAGYAKAFQYLLNKCGIECTYVTSATHAWNLIKLEGDYYHIDVTWGDGSDTKKEKNQTDAINYDCFCITTEELARLDSHTPVAGFPIPECTATKCNYHRRLGLYFEAFDFDRIRTIVCENVKLGKYAISFKFASSEVLSAAQKQLIDEGRYREIIQFAGLKANVKLDTSYVYSVRDDKLTIAFYIKKL